jgi:Zn-dependent protease with chaperone function
MTYQGSPHPQTAGRRDLATAALLYACTLSVHLLCAWIRSLVVLPLVWLTLIALDWTSATFPIAVAIGYAPLAISILTLLHPYGGWLWQAACGGRAPSAREQATYEQALHGLLSRSLETRRPHRWFITDENVLQAAVYGDTLMITCGLLASPSLPAVLAHELGHINTSDGALTAALHRLTTPPRRELRLPWRAISFFATGEIASSMLRLPWSHYWRQREFVADAYAAKLGQRQALADFLQANVLDHDLPVPFPWLSSHSHPSTEHRIERLLRGAKAMGSL